MYTIVCVFVCSVWDALTDNYLPSSVSSWDGPNSETLNGNLSDDEVSELFLWSFLLTKYQITVNGNACYILYLSDGISQKS